MPDTYASAVSSCSFGQISHLSPAKLWEITKKHLFSAIPEGLTHTAERHFIDDLFIKFLWEIIAMWSEGVEVDSKDDQGKTALMRSVPALCITNGS